MKHAHGRSRSSARHATPNPQRTPGPVAVGRAPAGLSGRTPPRALAMSTARHTTPPGLSRSGHAIDIARPALRLRA